MIRITIDTDRPEYAGHAKWPELARVLRDLADKFERPVQEKYKIPMILMDAFGQHTGQVVEVGGAVPTDVSRSSPPCCRPEEELAWIPTVLVMPNTIGRPGAGR
jgi:hypothetical protein